MADGILPDHSQRAHAEHSASGSHRWIHCPASIREARGLPDSPSSEAARMGTAAHQLAEDCLVNGYLPIRFSGTKIDGFTVDTEMMDAVQVYLDDIRTSYKPGDTLLYEQRYQLHDKLDIPVPMFFTADNVHYRPRLRRLTIRDYKHGYNPVEAVGNPQLRIYALGAYLSNPGWAVREVETRIVQPRAPHVEGPVRSEVIDVVSLMDWAADLEDAVRRTLDPNSAHQPGEWCGYCKAKQKCLALQSFSLAAAQAEFSDPPDPNQLSAGDLAEMLHKAAVIKHWIAAVEARAYEVAESGVVIPGYHLAERRKTRRWTDEAAAEKTLLAAELDHDRIAPRKLVTPAQAEKLLGKDRKDLLRDLIIAESSGATLVPDTDPRKALAPSAVRDFASIPATPAFFD